MDHNTYPRIFPLHSFSILIYFLAFFVLFNSLAVFWFNDSLQVKARFRSQASYQEISTAIATINNDTHPTVVFLGGSAMWGGLGIEHAEQSVPYVMKQYLKQDVNVYNLAYPSARPLDELAILSQLKHVDLVIVDINSGFLTAIYNEGVREDYSKYIRVHNLLSLYRNDIFDKSSSTARCLNAHGLYPTQDYLGSLVSRLPLVKYKDEINYAIFGKHFSLFSEALLAGIVNLVKGDVSGIRWSVLFSPPRDAINNQVNQTVLLGPPEKLQPTLNSCLANALGEYVTDSHLPVIFYISPHSPIMTSMERKSPIYSENLMFLESLFSKNVLFNFDAPNNQVVLGDDFVDEVHFNAHGHAALAQALAERLKSMSQYKKLFK